MVLQQIQANVRLHQTDFLKPDDTAEQTEETEIHPQVIKRRHRLPSRILCRKGVCFQAEGKRIEPDVLHLSLPAHALVHLFRQRPLQPPGQNQEAGQGIQTQQHAQCDQQVPDQMALPATHYPLACYLAVLCLFLCHKTLPLSTHGAAAGHGASIAPVCGVCQRIHPTRHET